MGTVGRFDNDVDGSARKVAEGDGRESMARLGSEGCRRSRKGEHGSVRKVAEGDGREGMARLGRLQKVMGVTKLRWLLGGSSASRSPSIF